MKDNKYQELDKGIFMVQARLKSKKRNKSVSLGRHIRRYFLLFATVPMILASILCILFISAYYEYANSQEMQYSVTTMQQELSRQMESWEELLQVCAGSEEIIQQMREHRILDEAGRSIVNSLLAGRGDTVQLHLISTNGRFRYSTGSIPNIYQMPMFNEWPFFAKIRESDFAVRATNLSSYNAHPLALSIGTSVRYDGQIIGYAVLDIELSEIQELLRSYRSINIADIILISNERMVVCSMFDKQKNGILLTDESVQEMLLEARGEEAVFSKGYVVPLDDWGKSGLTIITISDKTPFISLLPAIATGLVLLVLCAVVMALCMGSALSRRVMDQLNRLPDASMGSSSGYEQHLGDFEEIVNIGEKLNELNRQNHALITSNQEKEQLLATAELNLLKAQMRPHFIYNVLNDIKSMAKLGKGQQIVKLIVSFSALLRSTLSVHEEFATLAEEVDLVKKYVQMQNLRGSLPVQLKIHLEEDLNNIEIPRLILQPLVENSIVHGLRGRANPILLLDIQRAGEALIVRVADNGRGIQQSNRYDRMDSAATYHSGIGLKNIARRLRLYYGMKGQVKIKSKAGAYTVVNVQIPLKTAE